VRLGRAFREDDARVPEGTPEADVGNESGERAEHAGEHGDGLIHRHDRLIAVAEAVLLSIVTITAAWSGYSAAKWHAESSLGTKPFQLPGPAS
jgi:hypothetical protein